MQALTWLWRGAIFFVLFAFALNNQNDATLHWFFGAQWHGPMVFIVLGAFTLGCAVGVLAMVPSWWRHRRSAMRQVPKPSPSDTEASSPEPAAGAATEPPVLHPPREGL